MREGSIIQQQWNMIYSFFKTTTEPFDNLKWDGNMLEVWLKGEKVETYTINDLARIIEGFSF